MTEKKNGQTQAIVRRKTPADIAYSKVFRLLDENRDQIAAALPRGATSPERMIRVALTSLRRNPNLLKCDPFSIMGCLLQAAQLGLETDGITGQAHLVPFKSESQLIIGYRGLILLAFRTNLVSNVFARVVREGDEFRYSYGLGSDELVHVPSDAGGKVSHVYGVIRMKDGGDPHFEVMTRDQVEAIRSSSPGGRRSDSPWKTHWEEMARKTAIRRVLKPFPFTAELSTAVSLDELAEAGISQNLSRATGVAGPGTSFVIDAPSALDRLAARGSQEEGQVDGEDLGDAELQEEPQEALEPDDELQEDPPAPVSLSQLRERADEVGVPWDDLIPVFADAGVRLTKAEDRIEGMKIIESVSARMMEDAARDEAGS